MPYPGEHPITSYFSRLNATGNHSRLKKRKRSPPTVDNSVESEKLPVLKKQRARLKPLLLPAETEKTGAPTPPLSSRSLVKHTQSMASIGRSSSLTPPPPENLIPYNPGVASQPNRNAVVPPSYSNPLKSFSSDPIDTVFYPNDSIPSSQSQDGGNYLSYMTSTRTDVSSTSRSQLFPGTSIRELQETRDLIIESSQTQPVLECPSPHRSRTFALLIPGAKTSEDVVQSSQSQEIEFEYPPARVNQIIKFSRTRSRSSPMTPPNPLFLARSVSDELFSIPPRNESNPYAVNDSEEPTKTTKISVQNDANDSCTEDESEIDVETTLAKDSYPAHSLPSVLIGFRDMFGDGDGSYPDDFPESLR